ncbi:MAG: protein kinase [Bacteroidetes bacterium]|jgi:serine/threonine protein kinase/tetratricopeptide (TPR) repeat protein|nr:protein kinase [Bacteroidota bacterium]
MQEGTTILHYEILEKIGEGGMGVVYKAQDTKLDRTVALKFLPPHLTKSKKDRKRFLREAKSAAALNHPNICTIHAVEEHEGKDFISMEYIDGQTLRENLESGKITFDSALEYAVQIAEALSKAHDKGIIHRDIKPGNIMIDANNQVKVMDFGLAKMTNSAPITQTGATVGTMAYMAPEQIEGKQIDPRADLFSFGVVLYEMLAGERPFQGQYDAALSYAIVNEEPIPIEDYFPKAPQKLIEFFDRILAKNPDKRIESAAAARNLLEDIKESSGSNLQRTQKTMAATPSTNQETDSGSTTISITLPNFGFRNKSIGKTRLFAGLTSILIIILFAGWWFMGGDGMENSTESIASVGESEITDRSIAVLPFNNLSGTDEITSITRGIHDDLLTRLSNIGDLRVTSRTSVAHYRDTNLPISVIADSLGVRWIMVGGVQQGGDQIQVNAQLIDPQTDANVWADSYRRELTAENLFAIQEDITGEIAQALQAELSESEEERIAMAPTENLEAYQLYIRGRQQLAEALSRDQIIRAASHFGRALEQDSTYALAWAGLSDAIGGGFLGEGRGLGSTPDSLSLPEVSQLEAARRSLKLDPNLAEAHAALGGAHYIQRNAPEALRSFEQAVELRPSYAQAHYGLAQVNTLLGRREKALEHLKLAEEINPNHVTARHSLFDAYNAVGQPEKALEEAREQLREHPYPGAIWGEARALHQMGRHEDAVQTAEKRLKETNSNLERAVLRNHLVRFEAAAGDTTQARGHLEELTKISLPKSERSRYAFLYAQAYLTLGDVNAGIDEFRKQDDWWIIPTSVLRNVLERFHTLAEDPRYQELFQEVNEYWGLNPDGSIPDDIGIPDDL